MLFSFESEIRSIVSQRFYKYTSYGKKDRRMFVSYVGLSQNTRKIHLSKLIKLKTCKFKSTYLNLST